MLRAAPIRVVELRNRFLIDEALSILRHDLRNRLASVRNAAFYLKRKGESAAPALFVDDKRVPQMFQLIESEMTAAEIALRARVEPASPEARADAREVMEAMAGYLQMPDGVRFDGLAADPVPARVSFAELELAMHCLIENAVEAVAEHGGTVSVRCVMEQEEAVVEVNDDGQGFAPGADIRCLEPFFTTRPGRFGLGLNIARRVAIRVGGTLDVVAGAQRGVRARLVFRRG